jgi:hypothetical protein
MAQSKRKEMEKRDLPKAYGRYSASDQAEENVFKERGRSHGRDRSHRGDRSDEVPGTYEGSKGNQGERDPQGARDQAIGGAPRRGSDDYPKDAGVDRKS